MKKIFSALVTVVVMCNIFIFSVSANDSANITSSVDLPIEDCEYGFLFKIENIYSANIPLNVIDDIEIIEEDLGLCYAPSLDVLTNIAQYCTIQSWECNIPIESNYASNDFSLFGTNYVSSIPELEESMSIEEMINYFNDENFYQQWEYFAMNVDVFRKNDITGDGVTIGIFDYGLYRDDPDLNYDNIIFKTSDGYFDYTEKTIPDKSEYENSIYGTHGTRVTKVIASQVNNSIGYAGLTDDVKVIFYEAPAFSTSFSYLIQAYKDGCDVINMSYGHMQDISNYDPNGYFDECIDFLSDNGVILVAGVGNQGDKKYLEAWGVNDIFEPAAFTNVIGVGALGVSFKANQYYRFDSDKYYYSPHTDIGKFYTIPDMQISKASYSSANETVFITAPNHASGHGTSFTSPIVAAAAIGVKQMRPYVNTDMFKEILKATAIDLDEPGYDINTGWGMIDFGAIYEYVSNMPETAPETTPSIEIDYENNQLTRFLDGTYIINGVEYDTNVEYDISKEPHRDSIPIDESWYGKTISIVKKASKDYFTDSEPQMLYIPALPEAPDLVVSTNDSGVSKINSLSNLEYQYAKNIYSTINNDVWRSVTSSRELEVVRGNIYNFRYSATDSSFASKIKVIDMTGPSYNMDYFYEQIKLKSNLHDSDYVFVVNGEEYESDNGNIPIKEEWYGTTVEAYTKSTTEDGDVSGITEIAIPERPEAPDISNVYIKYNNEQGTVYANSWIIGGMETSKMQYKSVNSDEWQWAYGSYSKINPEKEGKMYEIRTKGDMANKAFPSKSAYITADIPDETPKPTDKPVIIDGTDDYDITTSVSYDGTYVNYEYTNNTDNDIEATGIIAVYDVQNRLISVYTFNTFKKGFNGDFVSVNGVAGIVKFLVWSDLQSLQPYQNAKVSECFVGE